jgi:hypothetical protein
MYEEYATVLTAFNEVKHTIAVTVLLPNQPPVTVTVPSLLPFITTPEPTPEPEPYDDSAAYL